MSENTITIQSVKHIGGLKAYKMAFEVARKAGMPMDVNFWNKEVIWQIAPNDSALSARVRVVGSVVMAILTMKYMGRVVQMIRIVFDGIREISEGLLYRDDVEKAFQVFRTHIQSMTHGPVLIPCQEIKEI